MKSLISSGIIAGAAAGLLALAAPAFAQTATTPAPSDCTAGAGVSAPCQNHFGQTPGAINNGATMPPTQTTPGAVGPQGGSGIGTGASGGTSGGAGASGSSAGGASGGGVGGGSGGSGGGM